MKKIFFILLPSSYLFILLLQIDQSMLEDLGRHLKMGEAILQCMCVPQTNLFSYTHPDFPVINHEWLTQIVLYFFYKNFGLQSLLILKMIIISLSFGIIFFLAKQKSSWYWVTIASMFCLIIFSSRFRVRPEMLSYLFISLFLLIIYLYQRHCEVALGDRSNLLQKYSNEKMYMRLLRRPPAGGLLAMTPLRLLGFAGQAKYVLLLLPLIQLLWVNMHIYFVLGIMIYGTFLIEKIILYCSSDLELVERESRTSRFVAFGELSRRIIKEKEFQFLFFIGMLILLATFLNPQLIKGALLPFTFLQNYGLSVEENMSVFDFGKYAPSFIYTLTLQVLVFEVLVGIFLITLPILFQKKSISTNLNAFITAFLGLRFVRSMSLFGLFGLQPLAEKFTLLEESLRKRTDQYLVNTLKAIILVTTLFVSYVYTNGLYQNKILQFRYQPYAEDATRFIINNNIKGPIFNNYHIGNYLIYGLYPKEKIFIDARPEMYPASFLKDYERMLVDQDYFNQQVKKYDINLIVFGVQLEDPLTIRPFMLRQIQSKEWIPVFADGNVTILVKNDTKNQEIIEKLGLKL